MTYFLGRDLNAYIGTESAFGLHWSGTTASTAVTAAASNRTFAMPLASGVVTSTTDIVGVFLVQLTHGMA